MTKEDSTISRAEMDLLYNIYRNQVKQLHADGVVTPFKACSCDELTLANSLVEAGMLASWTEPDDIFPRFSLTPRGVLRCMAQQR